ncbi:MAG TPA: TIR domain-containing protein [Anaerolineales bacterium]|nr:TIR domain-containing protein [Anaerolineales bacterium]
MAPEKQRHTFISYSRVNKNFALKLAHELKAAGFPIWLDQLDIPAGARWDDEIEKALRECGIFLTILTPDSIASENAKDEIGYAIDHGKRILPVLLEECDIPLRLRRFQYVDFTSMNYDQGVSTAKELLSKLMKEQSLPSTKRAAVSKERPTRPILREAVQAEVDRRQAFSAEPEPVPHKSPSKRPAAMYAGFAILALLVLAGGALFLRNGVSSPSPTLTSEPTREFTPTVIAAATAISITHSPEPKQSAVQEFNGDKLASWTFFRKSGREDSEFSRVPNDGKLVVHISVRGTEDWWGYLFNEALSYDDVKLEVLMTNKGFNNNGVSLICRRSDQGWYEFWVSNSLRYEIYAFGPGGEFFDTGSQLASSVSNQIREGHAENTITATCKGNELSLEINGETVITRSARYDLPAGNIGIGFWASPTLPVDVEIESLKVSEP